MMPMLSASAVKAAHRSSLLLAALTLSACGGNDSGTPFSHTTITTNAGHFSTAAQVATPAGAPTDLTYPIGWISFTIVDVPVGGTAAVTFTFPAGTNPDGYLKQQNGSYAALANNLVSVSGNTLTLRITDGGPFDGDGIANGVIVDPGAPFIFGAGSSSSSSSSSSGASSSSSSSSSGSSSGSSSSGSSSGGSSSGGASSGSPSSSSSSSSSSGAAASSGSSSGATSSSSSSSSGVSSSSGTASSSSSGAAVTVQTVYSFQGGTTDGQGPLGGVVQASNGNFFGTTLIGGSAAAGTVYKLTPAGVETVLYEFKDNGSDGAYPISAPVVGNDGNLYGTAAGTVGATTALAASGGTVFKLTAGGAFTSLHVFAGNGDGVSPNALVQSGDGNFYGTTQFSGVSSSNGGTGSGTVFKITSAGILTTLHTFSGAPDGANPTAGLILASDGNFYGTTSAGGSHGIGSVFKMTPAGTLTVLYSFGGGADGYNPAGPLFEGSDGNFYGTTVNGGTSASGSNGTVFKLTPSGTLTTLYAFAGGADGAYPSAGLVQIPSGDFFGTTTRGGGSSNGVGTVFKLSVAGALTPLYDFSANPSLPSALIRGADGALYGTLASGGTANGGEVYKFAPK